MWCHCVRVTEQAEQASIQSRNTKVSPDQGRCEMESGRSWPPAPPSFLFTSSPPGPLLTGPVSPAHPSCPQREHPLRVPPGAARPLTREHLSLLRDPNQGQRGADVTPGVESYSVNIRAVSLKRLRDCPSGSERDIRFSKKRLYPSFDSIITPLIYPVIYQ